jgi:hypothetical protein
MSEAIGWIATALTASSYFTRRQALLRRTQAGAAALWLVYGAFIHSMPVVTANVIVGGVALWSSFRTPAAQSAPAAAEGKRTPAHETA